MALFTQFLQALKTGLGITKMWDGTTVVNVTTNNELKIRRYS